MPAWRLLAVPLCLGLVACGSSLQHRHTTPADPAHSASASSPAGNYNTIATAVRVRDQALHLKAWNEKAEAAQLALRTLVSLEGARLSVGCERFVAHLYAELTDLSAAYAGEDWRPMFAVVARDPRVGSQCAVTPATDRAR